MSDTRSKASRSKADEATPSSGSLSPVDVIDAVSGLIEEFGLAKVRVSAPGFKVAFSKAQAAQPMMGPVVMTSGESSEGDFEHESEAEAAPIPAAVGIPITSPMTGIFYSRSSPGSAPFVQEGATVSAGQVVCLIEAMKVFNEITAPASGTVGRIGPKDGEVVQSGDILITVLP